MRLATFTHQNRTLAGVVLGEHIAPLPQLGSFPDTMLALIAAGPAAWQALRNAIANATGDLPLDEVELLAPVPRTPKNVMCLGLNYAEHAAEHYTVQGRDTEIPQHPIVFTKAPTAINKPHGDIPYDATVSEMIDYEAELGVIIGVGGRSIAPEQALQHVFGYTVINDVSARDIQRQHKQYFLGKSLDGACPMGPWIVTADEIPDPQTLGLRTHVNGVLKQESTTAYQIFNVATTISILSRGMTLEPGDVIATGTPSGVGFARTPPEYLKPGDVVECEIDQIGKIRNTIVQRAHP